MLTQRKGKVKKRRKKNESTRKRRASQVKDLNDMTVTQILMIRIEK
jgi:hypothetical protein